MSPLADLISALHDPDPQQRSRAAAEFFRQGSERARRAIAAWLRDAELKNAFFLGADEFPEMTVGIAVRPERFEEIRKAMGMLRLSDVPPEHEAREFEAVFPGGIRLDIITMVSAKSAGAIGRYLEKFGEGIQQVELFCRKVDGATAILRERFSLVPLYPEARVGADETRVNFFLVSAGEEGKLLIELVEPGARH